MTRARGVVLARRFVEQHFVARENSVHDRVQPRAARSRFAELVDEAHAGDDQIITKNGEAYVALIDIAKLDEPGAVPRGRERVALLSIRHQRELDLDFGD